MINPLPYISALKSCELVSDNDDDGKVSPGDELRCTIRITNTGQTSPDSLQFCENLNTNVTYVPGSTTQGINDDPVADPVPLTTSTLDPDCLTVDYSTGPGLPVGGSDSVSYNIVINDLADLPNGLEVIEDSGTIKSGTGAVVLTTFDTRIQIALTPSFELRKTVSNTGSCPGIETTEVAQDTTVMFCFEVVNTGNTALNGVVVTDPLLGVQSPLEYTGTIPIGGNWSTSGTMTAAEPTINTASATANPAYPDGEDISYFTDLSDTDQASFTIAAQPTTSPPTVSPTTTPIPNVILQKTVSDQGCTDGSDGDIVHTSPNATIYWCFNITNSGETDLEGVTLYDPQLGLNIENIGASAPAPAPEPPAPEPTNPTKTLDGSTVTVLKRQLRGLKRNDSAESPQLDFLSVHDHGRHLASTTCSDAEYDPRVLLLSTTCGAAAQTISCYSHYVDVLVNSDTGQIGTRVTNRFDEVSLDTCPNPLEKRWWSAWERSTSCDHALNTCGGINPVGEIANTCEKHPNDPTLLYTTVKVHVYTYGNPAAYSTAITCNEMARDSHVCTFEYALDCTITGYEAGKIHSVMGPAKKLHQGESYLLAVPWTTSEPMINIAKVWGYGPNGEYVSAEDQAENTIIGEQLVFAAEASNGTVVFVDESLASEAPSSTPSDKPTVSMMPSLSEKPTSNPSDFPTISMGPSTVPSDIPTLLPSARPSRMASASPTYSQAPTMAPSSAPSLSSSPSSEPSAGPSTSQAPTSVPSSRPSVSSAPTVEHSFGPSLSSSPSSEPSAGPSEMVLPPLMMRTTSNTICKMVSMTAVEPFALTSFAFNLDYSGCVAVTVEYRIDDGPWSLMCMAHDVYGQAPEKTIVNGQNCLEVIVLAGETVDFRLSTEPSNTCEISGAGTYYNPYAVFLDVYYTAVQEECTMPSWGP